ncbi:hypothetical protein KKB55_06620 [Myxococcota bacterium]|nr:hypothetical protein [Myxococcota bacterium]
MPALHFPYTSLTLSQTLKHLSKKSKITLAFAFFLTAVIHNQLYLLTSRGIRSDNVVIKDSEVLYVPNQAVLEVLSLGYHQAAADLLWIRTIGYFADHFDSDRKYQWLEHFIDQILALDPKFKRVYYWAGTNVLYGRRFTNPNVRLSNRFYEKALKQFPDDYEAPYRLGLNYYIEMKPKDEKERRYFKEIGLNYLEIAANIPDAPNNIRTLVASISDKLGKEQVALQYLIELYLTAEDQDK